MALFGLVQYFTWNGRLYWLRPTEVTNPFGPFANHNHFAGYMELLIPIPIALTITRAVKTELRVLFGFAAIVMGMAAVLSLSRGGIISVAAGMLFLGVMSLRLPRERAKATGTGSVSQTARGCARYSCSHSCRDFVYRRRSGHQSRDPGPADEWRLAEGNVLLEQGWVWRDTIAMIRANPVLGVGLGAYETAFSTYTKSDGSLRVPQAHNDYLQVVADCGVVGGLIAIWFIVLVFRAVGRGARSRDPLYRGLALGSGAGLFGLLVHSLFDFNLQLPSNALLFLLLSAVAAHVGAAATKTEGSTPTTFKRNSVELETATVSSASLVRGAS